MLSEKSAGSRTAAGADKTKPNEMRQTQARRDFAFIIRGSATQVAVWVNGKKPGKSRQELPTLRFGFNTGAVSGEFGN